MMGLLSFILEAKQKCYIGGGKPEAPCRTASLDVAHEEGEYRYLDSYFGGSDFSGQEVVWLKEQPVWAMSYHGRILRDDLITAEQTGTIIKAALSDMYRTKKHFLGGTTFAHEWGTYEDDSTGEHDSFQGQETIRIGSCVVYRLHYFGGLIRE
jgi:hypothetical protein